MPMFTKINAQIVPVHRPYWKDERLALAKETPKYYDLMPTNAEGEIGDVIIVKDRGTYQKKGSGTYFVASIEDEGSVLSQNISALNLVKEMPLWGWKLENGEYKAPSISSNPFNPSPGPPPKWVLDSTSASVVYNDEASIIDEGITNRVAHVIANAKVVLHGAEWVPLTIAVPAPPSSGTHTLKAVGGVMQWV